MKYLLIAYFAFTVPNTHWGQPEVIDTFESREECIPFQGANRFLYKDDPTVYIVCLQSAEI